MLGERSHAGFEKVQSQPTRPADVPNALRDAGFPQPFYMRNPKGMAFASCGISPSQRVDAVSPSVKVSPL